MNATTDDGDAINNAINNTGNDDDDFVIAGQRVGRGERRIVALPLPALYTHTGVDMPVQIVRGRRPGPRLFVSAAVHGDEINGIEIIRRLLAMPRMNRLRGTLIAVPVVNVFGLVEKSRYLPDRRDLNRSFPGSERGSFAARIAHLFLHEIVGRADYGIDLHTGAIHRSNLPQIRADLSDPRTRELALAFGVPVVLDSAPIDGSLRAAAATAGNEHKGVPLLLYEGGEALRFDELAIRAGVRGVIAVMREIGMLAAAKTAKTPPTPAVASGSRWARAPQSGVMRSAKRLGDQVVEGETLALISDPFGDQEQAVHAGHDGIIIGQAHLPLVNEGDALFHLARVDRPRRLAARVDDFHETLEDTAELANPDAFD